jgi:RNA polymerase sigma-70 factor (ECF subfamily)
MASIDGATDAELLVAAPDDLAAFEAFYRRYVRRVTAFAALRCSAAEDVADAVGQTFLQLIDAARRYDPSLGPPAPFVLGIVTNVLRDTHRRSARDRALVTKLAGRDLLDPDDVERIEAALDAGRAARVLAPALATVPPGEQEMLRRVAGGQSPRQAAEDLGISPGAGRVRLSRARRRLRRYLVLRENQE